MIRHTQFGRTMALAALTSRRPTVCDEESACLARSKRLITLARQDSSAGRHEVDNT